MELTLFVESWISPLVQLPPSGRFLLTLADGLPPQVRQLNLANPSDLKAALTLDFWMTIPAAPLTILGMGDEGWTAAPAWP